MKNLNKSNFHTHSTFCDGKNTPEEIIGSAIEKGFYAIGFSGHGYTHFDLRYCMKDTEGYIAEISRLKEKYRGKIQVYLGVEEDAFAPVDRCRFDYIIGSSHYFHIEDKYLPIDSSYDYFKRCLDAFRGDTIKMAEVYYGSFCAYIKQRRPDIIGHFDLITKFEEMDEPKFFGNPAYERIVEAATREALRSNSIFEVNTGAISRAIRSTVYPSENLLYILKREGGKIILSSDSHAKDTLDAEFDSTRRYLRDVGFDKVYTLSDGKFIPTHIT